MPEFVLEQLPLILNQVNESCVRHNRDLDEVRLIAVSKRKSVEHIRAASQVGQILFAENYVQEFLEKWNTLQIENFEWHFIGSIQTNKVKDLVGRVSLIHTLDRKKLAQKINERCQQLGIKQKCLIQVKIAQEETKAGCDISEVEDLLSYVNELDSVEIDGFMTIGTATHSKDVTKKEFDALRNLRDDINKKNIYKKPLQELSMGMSGDFDLAIEAGSTYIRVGSKIFGNREV